MSAMAAQKDAKYAAKEISETEALLVAARIKAGLPAKAETDDGGAT